MSGELRGCGCGVRGLCVRVSGFLRVGVFGGV